MEQTYDASTNTITITVTAEKIRQMDALDFSVYHTPGSSQVYIDSRPQFQDDRGVVDVQDLLDAMGYDDLDGVDDDEYAEVTINL
jgi:hypothetical protein